MEEMNRITTPVVIHDLDEKYRGYLHDESKLEGRADSISFPKSAQEVQTVLTVIEQRGMGVTVQGGRTGIVGAAVPAGGHVMNLSRMDGVLDYRQEGDRHLLDVQPGVSLMELTNRIQTLKSGTPLFWPVDPTEPTATVGGVVASDAKGISAWYYGGAARYIEELEVVLPGTGIQAFRKGDRLPDCEQDAIRIFLGSEGMLGVITRLTLELLPKPTVVWGISFFFAEPDEALSFGDALMLRASQFTGLAAAEYLERSALDIIQQQKPNMSKIKELPDPPKGSGAMVYLELHGDDEEFIGCQAEQIMELAAEYGSDPDTAWAVVGDMEIERMRSFRHAAAECANVLVEEARQQEPCITKLSTDMSAGHIPLAELAAGYRRDIAAAGLRASVFGHIPHAHLHVNLLPKDHSEYLEATRLLHKWAEEMAAKGGRLSTEHGVGKLKRELNVRHSSREEVAHMRALKELLDPHKLLNPHNYWPE